MAYDFEETLPPGVRFHDGEEAYLYRGDQLLVSLEADDEVREVVGDAYYEEGDEDVAQALGIRRYVINDGRDAREVAQAAEEVRPGSATLNHVLVVQPRRYGHTAAPATPDERPEALSEGGSGGGLPIAVLDTGFAGRPIGTVSFTQGDEDRLDDDGDGALDAGAGHGTFVAGIVASLAPTADVQSIRVLDTHGAGTDFDIAAGLRRAASCRIVNLSLGGPTLGSTGLPVLSAAIDSLDPEIVVVAAAGNAGRARPFFPGAFKRVICVGATDENGRRADFSNYGWWVDACAVGVDVRSAFPEFQETSGSGRDFSAGGASWLGTSFAAPKVAAAIALIAERDGRSPREAARYLLHDAGLPVLGAAQLGTLIDPENLP